MSLTSDDNEFRKDGKSKCIPLSLEEQNCVGKVIFYAGQSSWRVHHPSLTVPLCSCLYLLFKWLAWPKDPRGKEAENQKSPTKLHHALVVNKRKAGLHSSDQLYSILCSFGENSHHTCQLPGAQQEASWAAFAFGEQCGHRLRVLWSKSSTMGI